MNGKPSLAALAAVALLAGCATPAQRPPTADPSGGITIAKVRALGVEMLPGPVPAYRHLADDEIRAIASYLRNGVRPVSNRVPDSEGPPDFWGTEYTPDKIDMLPAPAFPTSRERQFW